MNILEVDYKGSTLFLIGVLSIFVSVVLATPLCVIPGKDSIERIIIKRTMDSNENLRVTFWFITICWGLACLVPNIGDILTIIGATTNPFVGFILPIVFYLKLYPEISFLKKFVGYSVIILTVFSSTCIIYLFIYD